MEASENLFNKKFKDVKEILQLIKNIMNHVLKQIK